MWRTLKAIPSNTARATYGVPSNGTIPHFDGTRIEAALNLPMTRVPYRGGAAVVKDLIGGHLPFAVITVSDALPSHQAGSVRIVAVNHDTSVAMIERTYSRYIGDHSDALARAALLDTTEPSAAKVVPLHAGR